MANSLKEESNSSLEAIAIKASIKLDSGQLYVSSYFNELFQQINKIKIKQNLIYKLFQKTNINTDIKGIYLFGGVGRGKSMIMDLFFHNAPIKEKRRLHFHDFMKEVHQRILQKSKKVKNQDSVLLVAKDLAKSAKLLCFDEMEVRDIADAMILSRLFNVMFDEGTILVTTSNQPPEGLYKNGLHRDRILPFISKLKLKTHVIKIPNGEDWRERSLSGNKVWLSPINKKNKAKIDKIFLSLSTGFEKKSENILIAGRTVFIPQVAAGIARIDFDDLCNKPLAASDYTEIASRYKGVIIDNIPILNNELRNQARRFIWLVDALYDKNCFLIATADADFRKLYQGNDWDFEFDRTVSRIVEMSQV